MSVTERFRKKRSKGHTSVPLLVRGRYVRIRTVQEG